ncbi:MAG TPA: hypothetical protein VIO61_12820 [Anaerolineaceae bacterium]
MRSFAHWTPRYLINRISEKFYRLAHPHAPWLTPSAIDYLQTHLKLDDKGIEFGSGRSTLWFAPRVASLISVEHDPVWYKKVTSMLAQKGYSNVSCYLHLRGAGEPGQPEYLADAVILPDCSLDFALVDGIYRDLCLDVILPKIKPRGMIIVDNINLYMPCASHAPNSIPLGKPAASPLWEKFMMTVSTWESIWTSNGVTDTAIFIKPEKEYDHD